MRNILITDFAWKDLKIEEEILRQVGANIMTPTTALEAELIQLAPTADGILTCWKPVTGNVIRVATRCLAICRFGIGLDNIDVATASETGIIVTNVPSYCVDEVSDHAMALILSCARKTAFYDRNAKSGSYLLQAGLPLYRIKGKTLGLIGFGKIGRAVFPKARAFGLNILVYDPYVDDLSLEQAGVEPASFLELVRRSDFISIHVPLTAGTSRLFTDEVFRHMKPTAIIVNTSRGDIIDSSALLTALEHGIIAGAGLDVLSQEPPRPNDRLVAHPRVVITPHAAFNSEESLLELRTTAATQMADVLSGKLPENIINEAVLSHPALRCQFALDALGSPDRGGL